MELRARPQAFYASTCLVIAGYSLLFAPVTAFGAESLDGIWRSRGYGYIFNFQGPALKAFEVTPTTCVPGFTATRLPTPGSDRGVTFTTSDRDVFFVRPGGDAAHQTLHFEGSASDMRIDRLQVCRPSATTRRRTHLSITSKSSREHGPRTTSHLTSSTSTGTRLSPWTARKLRLECRRPSYLIYSRL